MNKPAYNMEFIGRKLRECRIKNGYSAETIRKYIGLGTVQSIYRIENGKQMPSTEALLLLMELYGLSPEDLKETVYRPMLIRQADFMIRCYLTKLVLLECGNN